MRMASQSRLDASLGTGFAPLRNVPMKPSFSAAAKAIIRQRPIDLSDRDETRFEQTIRGVERELPIHVGCATAARLEWLNGTPAKRSSCCEKAAAGDGL